MPGMLSGAVCVLQGSFHPADTPLHLHSTIVPHPPGSGMFGVDGGGNRVRGEDPRMSREPGAVDPGNRRDQSPGGEGVIGCRFYVSDKRPRRPNRTPSLLVGSAGDLYVAA